MASIKLHNLRNEDNSILMVVLVPPRRNGEPNLGAFSRINEILRAVSPDAFDPDQVVPHAIASEMLRDGMVVDRNTDAAYDVRTPSREQSATPNAPYEEQAIAHHAEEAPMPPPIVEAIFPDPERDDDEGETAEPERYPPGTACNITGECE